MVHSASLVPFQRRSSLSFRQGPAQGLKSNFFTRLLADITPLLLLVVIHISTIIDQIYHSYHDKELDRESMLSSIGYWPERDRNQLVCHSLLRSPKHTGPSTTVSRTPQDSFCLVPCICLVMPPVNDHCNRSMQGRPLCSPLALGRGRR